MLRHNSRRQRNVAAAYVLAAATIALLFLWYWHSSADASYSLWPSRGGPAPTGPAEVEADGAPAVLLPPPPEFPADYDLSPGREMCDRMYGRGYFRHIDRHQHPYCESTSSSSLQCFSAPRLPFPWQSQWTSDAGDPICIARGVFFDPGGDDKKYFRAHCNPRDFAAERQRLLLAPENATNPVDPSTDLSGVPNLADLAEYWGGSGVGGELQAHWDFGGGARGCNANANNGEWLLVVRREATPNIFHKLMNLWQTMVTLDALQVARNSATGRPWMTKEDVASMQIVFDDNEPQEALDDWWRMLNGKAPAHAETLPPRSCYGNVVLPLAGSSSPFWAALLEKVHHEPCQEPFLIDAFRRRVFRHLDLVPRAADALPNEHPTITFVNRTQNRKLYDADGLLAKVRARHPESLVRSVDLAGLTLREQVALAAETDVFVGHHGAGLMHLLFLPADAAVVEITSSRGRKFRSVSRLRGLAHFEADCLERAEYEHRAHGTPLPDGWWAGADDENWQAREYAYLLEDDFLGVVDAAVRSQQNKRYSQTGYA